VAKQGDVIENPRRRERVLLLETAAETGGKRLVMRVTAEPSEVGPPMHYHPKQKESFAVTSGTLTYVTGTSGPRSATAGETVVIEAGVRHTWWNAGPERLQLDGMLEPAGRFQLFIETVYGLIRDGKVTARGVPNLLQMAVIAREFRNDIVFTATPRPARVLALPLLAAVGRLLGYRPWYPRYSGPEPTSEANDLGPAVSSL
jgi:quercetin dioxygenase-like cupin family protein